MKIFVLHTYIQTQTQMNKQDIPLLGIPHHKRLCWLRVVLPIIACGLGTFKKNLCSLHQNPIKRPQLRQFSVFFSLKATRRAETTKVLFYPHLPKKGQEKKVEKTQSVVKLVIKLHNNIPRNLSLHCG